MTQIDILKNATPVFIAKDTQIHPEVLLVMEEALGQIDETVLPPFSRQVVNMGESWERKFVWKPGPRTSPIFFGFAEQIDRTILDAFAIRWLAQPHLYP